jgi:transcription antitermination factor NusG
VNHEKRAKDRLTEDGLIVFCPLRHVKVRWSDRWKKIYKPVMPGYLFAYVTEAERIKVLEDPSVLYTVFWNKKPVTIRQEEIEAMIYLIDGANAIDHHGLEEGFHVIVNNGYLAGYEGVVVKVARQKVTLKIEGLNMDFIVEIPARFIKKSPTLAS